MTFTISEKKKIEKLILINILGALDALDNDIISINESEMIIFTPYTFSTLKEKKIRGEIIDLLMECCELEDIESIIPYKLKSVIKDMKRKTMNILSDYEEYSDKIWVRIQ